MICPREHFRNVAKDFYRCIQTATGAGRWSHKRGLRWLSDYGWWHVMVIDYDGMGLPRIWVSGPLARKPDMLIWRGGVRELTVSPGELVSFAPWVLGWAQAIERNDPDSIPDPPGELCKNPSKADLLRAVYLWTLEADRFYHKARTGMSFREVNNGDNRK